MPGRLNRDRGFARAVKFCDMSDQSPRQFEFRIARQTVNPMVVEQHQFAVVGADRGLSKICREQGQLLPATLGFRVLLKLFAFGSEADAERRIGSRGDCFNDVRIRSLSAST